MKKTITFWILVLTLSVGIILYSQDVDEVLNKYYKTMGGLKKLRAWKGMKGEGTLEIQSGLIVPMTLWLKLPNRIMFEFIYQDQTNIVAYDGENAWSVMPLLGITEPESLSQVMVPEIKSYAYFYPFVDFKKKGYRFELVGKEIWEGSELSKIKLTRKDGSETFHFIDNKSGRELKIIQNIRRGEIDFAYETIKSDFRKVKSLEIPFSSETRIDGNTIRKIILEKVELGVLIDNNIFKIPSKKKDIDNK